MGQIYYRILLACVLLSTGVCIAQSPAPVSPEIDAIRQKEANGIALTLQETDTIAKFRAERAKANREAYLKDHTPQSSTGLTPLTDLGSGLYKGEQGGLYPGGKNVPPASHLKTGVGLAKEIKPLDVAGHSARDGKIVLLAIGFSNPFMEFPIFQKAVAADPDINPRLVTVNGCVPGMSSTTIADPTAKYWEQVARALATAGVTADQVQAIWLKEVVPQPKSPFPVEAKQLQGDMEKTLHILHNKYSNLKVTYLATRTYGGYTEAGGSPEPWAYETGFGVKWVVSDQLAGKPEMNFDPKHGPVVAPWVEWGPYFWTDGVKGRKDGFVYLREDVGVDGLHPSMNGQTKIANLLMGFFKTDPTTRPWFLKASTSTKAAGK